MLEYEHIGIGYCLKFLVLKLYKYIIYHIFSTLDKTCRAVFQRMMSEYSEKAKDLFLHPKNTGETENPGAGGEVGDIVCGDALKLTLILNLFYLLYEPYSQRITVMLTAVGLNSSDNHHDKSKYRQTEYHDKTN